MTICAYLKLGMAIWAWPIRPTHEKKWSGSG